MKKYLLLLILFLLPLNLQAATIEELKDYAATFPEMPRDNIDLLPYMDRPATFTFASGTPFNDVEYTVFDTDYMDGETAGFDLFYPVDPDKADPGADKVKLIRCVSNVDLSLVYGAQRGARIILGTAAHDRPFFTRGDDDVDNDYLVIQNYDYARGFIQLKGAASDYALVYCTLSDGCATEGYYLFYTKNDQLDLIAFIYPCWDVVSGIGGGTIKDPTGLCNPDESLSLNNPVHFKYAEPVPASPAISEGGVQFGSAGKEIAHGITTDSKGNIYVIGNTDGNLDGGSDPDNEMFIAKYNRRGILRWVTEVGTENGALLFDAVTDNDYLYAAGRTFGALPGFTNQGKWDAIIIKVRLDDGTIVATNQWGHSGIDGYGNITLDDAGHLYLSGAGSPVGDGSSDESHLVAKHSAADLQNIWWVLDGSPTNSAFATEAWGGITYVPGQTAGNGSLVVAGWYMAPGGSDSFVSLYENLDQASPTRIASETIKSAGTKSDWILDNAVDSQGNIYVAGYTTGDLGGAHMGDGDMFVAKFDPDLRNPVYAQWGTPQSDQFRKLVVDENDRLYAVGYTYGDFAGANADPSGLSGDIVIQKFNSNLVQTQAVQLGTALEERGYIYWANDTIYLTGMTEGSLTGANLGAFDGFILTLSDDDFSVVAPPRP